MLYVMRNKKDGTGTFSPATMISPSTTPRAIASGDFNGDTLIDLAYAGETTINLARNDGLGGLGVQPYMPGLGAPTGLAADQLDQDGNLDLVVVGSPIAINQGQLLVRFGDGAFGAPGQFQLPCGQQPRAVATLDLDGDGYPEIVAADALSRQLLVFSNKRDRTFAARPPTNTIGTPIAIAVGDLDGDGLKNDLAVAESGSTLEVFLGGGGGLVSGPAIFLNAPLNAVAVGDISGSPLSDIVACGVAGCTLLVNTTR
jgi:hypothetical protein